MRAALLLVPALLLTGCVTKVVNHCTPELYFTDAACREACDEGWISGTDECPENTCTVTCDGATPYCVAGFCRACAVDDHCGGTTPVCDPLAGECVGCTETGDCGGATPHCDPSLLECVQCTESSHCAPDVCDVATRSCMGCVFPADCPMASASRCESGACGQCQGDADCSHVAGAPRCVGGTCRACTAATEAADCGGNSCNPATGACTTTPVGSRMTCEACVADSECAGANERCVPMSFQGTGLGGFCLSRMAAGCDPPYSTAISAVSLSGASSEPYCGVDESTTSCAAVRNLLDGASCPSGVASECAAMGARCETVGALANRCTYSCSGAGECLETGAGSTCTAGYCGS